MKPYYFDKKAIQIVDKWIKEQNDPFQEVYLSVTWFEPIGSGPGGVDEQERTF